MLEQLRDPTTPRLVSLSAELTFIPVPRSAGSDAEDEPGQAADDQHEGSTRQSSAVTVRRARQQLLAPVADERCPVRRPSHASSRLSVRSWRTSLGRVAPSDSRTDSSFCRVVARDSSRFATLAQTIRRTSATTTPRIVTDRSSLVLTS